MTTRKKKYLIFSKINLVVKKKLYTFALPFKEKKWKSSLRY